jgi:1,6-anhydro-N-acetylmuramate kinase
MLHPEIAWDLARGQRQATLAQAAAIAQVRAAQRTIRGGGRPAPALLSRIWVSLRPRTA